MNHIKEFWESNAKRHGSSHWASWGDHFAIALELNVIKNHIMDGDIVLDVGCANGYGVFRQREAHLISIHGVDFCTNMIQQAEETKKTFKLEGVEFREGDVRALPFDSERFDLTYTTRTLINLPCWEDQMKGIDECLRVTKPGGKVIFSEGFYEPLVKLNCLRSLCGLEPLYEHDFNRYLKKGRLEQYLESKDIFKFKSEDFTSTYYLGSRFLRDLEHTTQEFEGYSNPINKKFYDLQESFQTEGFGIQIAYVIEKP